MQRIFKYGDIQNTSVTLDKELNILIHFVYWTPSYIIIYKSYTLLKIVRFCPTLYMYIPEFFCSLTIRRPYIVTNVILLLLQITLGEVGWV